MPLTARTRCPRRYAGTPPIFAARRGDHVAWGAEQAQANLELVLDWIDALRRGDIDTVADRFHRDVIEDPGHVSRLALVGAPAGLKRRVPFQLFLLGVPLVGQRLGRHLFSNATRDGSRKFWGQVLVVHPEHLDDLVLDVDVANERRNVESMLGLIEFIADVRRLGLSSKIILGERWRDLTTPTLLVLGERDVFASPAEGEALVAMNPNLRLVRVAGAGHIPWIDDPDTVVGEIERFLARATGRNGGSVVSTAIDAAGREANATA